MTIVIKRTVTEDPEVFDVQSMIQGNAYKNILNGDIVVKTDEGNVVILTDHGYIAESAHFDNDTFVPVTLNITVVENEIQYLPRM